MRKAHRTPSNRPAIAEQWCTIHPRDNPYRGLHCGPTLVLAAGRMAGQTQASFSSPTATILLEPPMSKKPVRVAVTGAAGQIGYAVLFRIASGEMLGKDQPVVLSLLEVPFEKAQQALQGVMMELQDCAFPLLVGMEAHSDPMTAFKDIDVALLVGARPRGPGMERKDLLEANAQIFTVQGKALDAVASRNVKVLVVGNPANTNAYIAMKSAPACRQRTSPPCCVSTITARCRKSRRRSASRFRLLKSCASGATTRRRCTRITATRRPTADPSRT